MVFAAKHVTRIIHKKEWGLRWTQVDSQDLHFPLQSITQNQLTFFIMNHNSGDNKGVGMTHEIISPKNQTIGQYWLGIKNKNQASVWSEMLSKSCYRILIMEFFTDYCLCAWCLQTSITQQLLTQFLFFLLLSVASAWEVLFGILQYIQCILHGLTSVLLCVCWQWKVLIWW